MKAAALSIVILGLEPRTHAAPNGALGDGSSAQGRGWRKRQIEAQVSHDASL